MPAYALSTKASLPLDTPRVFAFFSDARHLDRLTPPWLHFKLDGPLATNGGPFTVRPGTRLDYRLRLHGVPVSWTSEITLWDPPYQFVDEQRHGPYHWWIHTHTFTPVDGGGTEMTDEVRYCPRGGAVPHALYVRPALRRIFQYRHHALHRALGLPPPRQRARIAIERAW